MLEEKLSYSEAARQFEINDHGIIQRWERIYLEEGSEGLAIERTQKHRTANETTKRGRGGFDRRGAAIARRKRIPKKLASLGFGKRATASQKTQVI